MMTTDFTEHFNLMCDDIHANAIAHGWWDDDRSDGEIIALIHGELSETLEALRCGNPVDEKLPIYNSATVELADVVIRCMDYATARGWDLASAIEDKHYYNVNRPYKHGKAF